MHAWLRRSSEIGLLKAFGYRNRDIAVHYVKFVIAIGAVGVVGGWLVGFWLGRYETRLYADFYRFPFLLYHPGPQAFVIAAAVSLGSALAGALGAVREAAALSPAQAMQPPAPPLFRRAAVAEWSVGRRLDQPTRIVLRQILRRPGRSLATSAGIGLAVAVLIVSMQWLDAIRHMDVYFLQAQAQDVTVGFADPRSAEVLRDPRGLPGVQTTEPARVVSAKLASVPRAARSRAGLPAHQELYRVRLGGSQCRSAVRGARHLHDARGPPGVRRGDRITVEVLEGRRPVEIPVVELFETYIGTPAYIELGALSRLLYERPSVTAVQLRVDSREQFALFREPGDAAARECGHAEGCGAELQRHHGRDHPDLRIVLRGVLLHARLWRDYNAARIALSERGRELATLRVIGFTRAEILHPAGRDRTAHAHRAAARLWFGYALARLIVAAFETAPTACRS